MKIEIKERGSKKFYDEFLYIVSKYSKIKKNPKRKVRSLTFEIIMYIIFVSVAILLITSFYINDNSSIYLILIGMLSILLLLIIVYLLSIIKRINILRSVTKTTIIDLDEKRIEFIDEEKNIRINWSDIEFVLINKETICFIPKRVTSTFISIPTYYKKAILKVLNKYKLDSLVINNNSL